METCVLCDSSAVINRQESASRTIYNCPNCGVFILSDLSEKEAIQRRDEISSYLMMRKIVNDSETVLISFEKANLDKDYLQMTVSRIAEFFPRTFSEQMDMVLRNLGKMSGFPGQEIKIDDVRTAPMFYVKNNSLEALTYLMGAMQQAGLIEVKRNNGKIFPFSVIVSPKGWEQLENSGAGSVSKNMFAHSSNGDDDINSQFYSAFERVATECGYVPVTDTNIRADTKVTFGLTSAVKSSEVVICDFTAHTGGSYYAAGLARGLGKTCILTCHESKRKKLEFDESQYRIIFWDNVEKLRGELLNTIKALI